MNNGIKLPDWLKDGLGKKEEALRAAHGLTPKRDGWYKSIEGKTRYICKPMPVGLAVESLNARFPNSVMPEQPVSFIPDGLTLEGLAEQYLAREFQRLQTSVPRKLKRRTYDDKVKVLNKFIELVGPTRPAAAIGHDDFTKFRTHLCRFAPSTIRREMIYVNAMFNWASPGMGGMRLIPFPNFGPNWVKPSEDEMRTSAADNDKAFKPAMLRTIFKKAKRDPLLSAAAHLGLNAGFIPRDIADLPESFVDLNKGMIAFRRGKTGVERLCCLVPATVKALRAYMKARPERQPAAAHLFFVDSAGNPLAKSHVDANNPADGVSESNSLLRRWYRAGVGSPFTGLRSTFATIADNNCEDSRAIDMVLGHKVGRVQGHIRSKSYAKQFDPQRSRRVCETVWRLAFGGRSRPSEVGSRPGRQPAQGQAS